MASPEFKIVRHDLITKARTGVPTINNTHLETPVLWFGYRLNSTPKPWNYLDMKAIAVNAYEIFRDKRGVEVIECDGIHSYLGFQKAIMIDSGGFLFLKGKNFEVDEYRLWRLYEKSKPAIGVILDYPLSPFASTSENGERWLKTLENTQIMLGRNGNTRYIKALCK